MHHNTRFQMNKILLKLWKEKAMSPPKVYIFGGRHIASQPHPYIVLYFTCCAHENAYDTLGV